jgi:hypothetical protein
VREDTAAGAEAAANSNHLLTVHEVARLLHTHRVAISNHRLVSSTVDQVTFCWRDLAHRNEQKLMTLSLDEFLRRFLLHLLPKG